MQNDTLQRNYNFRTRTITTLLDSVLRRNSDLNDGVVPIRCMKQEIESDATAFATVSSYTTRILNCIHEEHVPSIDGEKYRIFVSKLLFKSNTVGSVMV